jgi:GNAT superfamily N-acetyltransferase
VTVEIRRFRPADSVAVADVIERCLREVNSRDYPSDTIELMCAHFTPRQIERLAAERQMFVAVDQGDVVGTVSRDGNKVYTMFVHPRTIGQGVGRRLMVHVEALAAASGSATSTSGPARPSSASTTFSASHCPDPTRTRPSGNQPNADQTRRRSSTAKPDAIPRVARHLAV